MRRDVAASPDEGEGGADERATGATGTAEPPANIDAGDAGEGTTRSGADTEEGHTGSPGGEVSNTQGTDVGGSFTGGTDKGGTVGEGGGGDGSGATAVSGEGTPEASAEAGKKGNETNVESGEMEAGNTTARAVAPWASGSSKNESEGGDMFFFLQT